MPIQPEGKVRVNGNTFTPIVKALKDHGIIPNYTWSNIAVPYGISWVTQAGAYSGRMVMRKHPTALAYKVDSRPEHSLEDIVLHNQEKVCPGDQVLITKEFMEHLIDEEGFTEGFIPKVWTYKDGVYYTNRTINMVPWTYSGTMEGKILDGGQFAGIAFRPLTSPPPSSPPSFKLGDPVRIANLEEKRYFVADRGDGLGLFSLEDPLVEHNIYPTTYKMDQAAPRELQRDVIEVVEGLEGWVEDGKLIIDGDEANVEGLERLIKRVRGGQNKEAKGEGHVE